MKKINICFILIIIHISFLYCIEKQEKEETCEGNSENGEGSCRRLTKEEVESENKKEQKKNEIKKEEKKEYELLYADLFLGQLAPNKTNNKTFKDPKYFDFRLNEKIINYLEEYGMIPFPQQRLIGKHQGNFLHFLHLGYEKKLPVFFSVDQMIYPYIEITKNLLINIMDKELYKNYYLFLENILNYGKKNKVDNGIMLYFALGMKFLNKNKIVFKNEICNNLLNKILNNDFNDTSKDYYNFTLLGYKRSINRLNFLQLYPIFKSSENLKNLFHSLRFFQNFIFGIKDELYTLYQIGKIINESGEGYTYKKFKEFFKYIFNEEENVMNPLEIYLLINENYPKLESKTEINGIYNEIKNLLIKNTTLKFMSKFRFFNKNEEEIFNEQKHNQTSLFSFSFNLEEWVNYQLLSIEKFRFFTSIYEFIDVAHHGKLMKKLIKDRYMGNNKTIGKLYRFRDGIDMSIELKETENIIKESYKNDKDSWLKSYENSFHYLLNKVGNFKNDYKKFRFKNNTKIEHRPAKIKIFGTLLGSFVHFKKDTLLFVQTSNVTCSVTGHFPEIFFDEQIEFYTTLKEITEVFKQKLLSIINLDKDQIYQKNIIDFLEFNLNKLFKAIDNILKIIDNQQKGINNFEAQNLINTLLYYDLNHEEYQGWYTELYKNPYVDKRLISINNNVRDLQFNLPLYASNFYIARPLPNFRFGGSIIYAAMNYNEIGVITVDDTKKGVKKFFLYSTYTGNEYPHGWSDTVNFENLNKLIYSRK